MKKNLLPYILLLFISSLKAQVVFCPAGSVWKSIHTRSWPDQTLETETVTYTGKQFMSPDTVKVLNHNRFYLDINNNVTGTTYLKQKGDTIFMKNARTQNSWQILYNFGAQVGDSWYNTLDASRLYTITVTSIQTVVINGSSLKQLTLFQHHNGGNRNNFSYNVTERLGSNMFIFTYGGMAASDGDNWRENLCYTDNTFGTYQYSNKSCDYTILLGVKETQNNLNEFILYPNPSSGDLNLRFENPTTTNDYTYYITNAIEQKIKEGRLDLSSEEVKLKTQDLSAGLYFLTLKSSNGNKELVKRFVKTN